MFAQNPNPWPVVYAAGVLGSLATLMGLVALWYL